MGRSRSRSRSRSGSRGAVDETRIQKIVDERQECRKNRDFSRADELREDLKDMGVSVDDTEGSWRGPKGLSGYVSGGFRGRERRDGDWDCPKCRKLNFSYRDTCFACGASRLSDVRYRDEDRRRGRGRSRSRRRRRDDSSSRSRSSGSRDRRRR
eukprot:TRINITY_DN99731_c0_g1_i1.p1 TRINITY_DN99731_c0_g1~~TRINITY_DN99731_c0_g1_i1.p1  ORF type:complete len:154 (-),score=7.62 TRINITY_DN99731_c0_g1_i1:117-578(-)